ncbi:MAG TPA: hypothetical protein P5274_01380 [Candidatus Paceibacterota bacterium]|nr:hypothetical protein [Candidatus Paceibacterota bacterium]
MNNWRNKIKWTLIVGLIIMAGAYLYLLSNSVSSVAARRDNEEKIVQLDAEVSALEADYLGEMSSINLDLARELGYIDAVGSASFATRKQPAGLLAANNEI